MVVTLIVVGFLVLALATIAVRDVMQKKHAVTRNFPLIGHFRYVFEDIGQRLRQYFFAGDLEERPYNRVTRSWVYASAKAENNQIGFGSQVDHHEPGFDRFLAGRSSDLSELQCEMPFVGILDLAFDLTAGRYDHLSAITADRHRQMRSELLSLFDFLRFQFLVEHKSEHRRLRNANLLGTNRRHQQQNRSQNDCPHDTTLSQFGC